MAKSTTIISLPQMVDLALNSPEVGVVNFTVLHSLLHVIVNQLDLGECNVEFRGSDSERLQNYISTAKPGPLITLTEYTVGPDGQNRTPKMKKGKFKEGAAVGQKEKEIAILKHEDAETAPMETEKEAHQTIVVVSKEKLDDPPKFAVAVTKEHFNKLTTDIHSLQEQVKELKDLPGNMGLIDALRQSGSSTKSSPVLDMFQILNLVKRLDATEVVMNKFASMMEDLAREQAHQVLRSSIGSGKAVVSKKNARIVDDDNSEPTKPLGTQSTLETDGVENINTTKPEVVDQNGAEDSNATNPEAAALDLLVKSQELRGSLGTGMATDITSKIKEIDARVTEIETIIKSLEENVNDIASIKTGPAGLTTSSFRGSADRSSDQTDEKGREASDTHIDLKLTNLSKMPSKEAISILQKELINFKQVFKQNTVAVKALKEVENLKEAIMTSTSQTMTPDVKIGQIDLKANDLKEQVNHLDTVYHQQFQRIDNGIQSLENEVSALWEKINMGMPAGDSTLGVEGQNVGELYKKLIQLQENMNAISDTASKLLNEKEESRNTLEIIIEQIELLKTVKADKEDLEDALADKADACQINRKVSHEQFDAAYDEISGALNDHLTRLTKQEEVWEQGLQEIQKEISGKLDKMELIPLRDFINSKLKMVQDKVKKISAMKEEYEAAGTKSRFLRNVNCISCDANVVMRKKNDITMFPKPYAMPPSKNVGPYLAYELDQLRKQQKASNKDHLCNRYCGGSHTVTTPQQRVMRVGHFMEQWGPEIAPVKDTLIRGTDGHLYKGRDDNQLRALAAKKAPTLREDNPPAIVISEVAGTHEGDTVDSGRDTVSKQHSATGVTPVGAPKSSVNDRPKTSIDRPASKQSIGVGRTSGGPFIRRVSTASGEKTLTSAKVSVTEQTTQQGENNTIEVF